MWDWVVFYGNPIPGMQLADLTEGQRATTRQVLDGMLRERSRLCVGHAASPQPHSGGAA
jgi:hypothetical protein